MNFDFELVLFYATAITGIVSLFDILFLAPSRNKRAKLTQREPTLNIISDYARAFFPVLLIVFLLRSFLFEPFRIPSGSLEPTLLIGDFIILNKYDYGLRLPILHKEIMAVGKPQRGDIAVFHWPPNPSYYFIKRVIGVPGDHISYINKELTINGKKIPQTALPNEKNPTNEENVEIKEEDLFGVKHKIFVDPSKSSHDFRDIVVPEGMYFMMGDNRDFSADSRYWGFVPDKNLVGKAVLTWLSWDSENTDVRWRRIGKWIN